jgi:hypothetical protein
MNFIFRMMNLAHQGKRIDELWHLLSGYFQMMNLAHQGKWMDEFWYLLSGYFQDDEFGTPRQVNGWIMVSVVGIFSGWWIWHTKASEWMNSGICCLDIFWMMNLAHQGKWMDEFWHVLSGYYAKDYITCIFVCQVNLVRWCIHTICKLDNMLDTIVRYTNCHDCSILQWDKLIAIYGIYWVISRHLTDI